MVVLRYREKPTEEPQTVSGCLAGDVVRITFYWRRNTQHAAARTALDIAARDRRRPGEYRLFRMGAESASVQAVPLGDGIATEPLYLVGVPETVLNEWMRKTG